MSLIAVETNGALMMFFLKEIYSRLYILRHEKKKLFTSGNEEFMSSLKNSSSKNRIQEEHFFGYLFTSHHFSLIDGSNVIVKKP